MSNALYNIPLNYYYKTLADFTNILNDSTFTNKFKFNDYLLIANWKYYSLEYVQESLYNFYQHKLVITDSDKQSDFENWLKIIYPQALYNLWLKTEMLSDQEIMSNLLNAVTRGAIKNDTSNSQSSNIISQTPSDSEYKTLNKLSWSDNDAITNKNLQTYINNHTGDDYLISEDLKRILLTPTIEELNKFLKSFTKLFIQTFALNINEYL